MKAEYFTFPAGHWMAGKVRLRPETPEEREQMDAFRKRVGSAQHGPTFEIIFRKRSVQVPQPTPGEGAGGSL